MNASFTGISIVFRLLVFALVSWFLVHVLAAFGIFLVIAYPIWWLLVPGQSVCLLCRSKRNGEFCPFCHRQINTASSISPAHLMSAVMNSMLILFFSAISLGVVVGEARLLEYFGIPPTPKTVSFIIPSKDQHRMGEIFPVNIEISGIKVPINTVQADIGFDPERVRIHDISTQDSFASIFIQKEINNDQGYARITGGLPNPGFSADHGRFAVAYFESLTPGVVEIKFLPSSLVLANDGRGTNVLKDFATFSYLILPEQLTPEEKAQQDKIFSTNKIVSDVGTQMKFYAETQVLGAEVGQDIASPPAQTKNNIFDSALNLLGRIDRFILDSWSNFLSHLKIN